MMDDIKKYDPEDIESLLLNKSFDELYPEERTFVLKHMENEVEYDSMRQTLLAVMSSKVDIDTIEPRKGSKETLMAMMVKEDRKGFSIWLNGVVAFLFPPQQQWFRKPGLQFAMACGLLLLMFTVVLPGDQHEMIAEATPKKQQEQTQTDEVKEAADEEVIKSFNTVENEVSEDLTLTSGESSPVPTIPQATRPVLDATDDDLYADSSMPEDAEEEKFQPTSGSTNANALRFDEKIADAKEMEESAKDVINATERNADVGLDTSVLFTDHFYPDNQIGNQLSEVTVLSSEAATRSTTSVTTIESMAIEESLFKKRDNTENVVAPTKKYKDLIDLLYTAL
jgi:hypothetical protein